MTAALTIGKLCEAIGQRTQRHIEAWQIRRAIQRGLLPDPPRFGAYRVFAPEDIPVVESALREAGYLPREGATSGR